MDILDFLYFDSDPYYIVNKQGQFLEITDFEGPLSYEWGPFYRAVGIEKKVANKIAAELRKEDWEVGVVKFNGY